MRGLPAGETVGPCADAGYYAVVKPLAVGEHVIEIQGTLGELEVDATYEITVSRRAEPRFAAAAAALEHLVAAAARKRAWPRSTPGRSLRTICGRLPMRYVHHTPAARDVRLLSEAISADLAPISGHARDTPARPSSGSEPKTTAQSQVPEEAPTGIEPVYTALQAAA